MVSKKNALGKGLSALLENSKTDITSTADNTKDVVVGSISRISINHITPNPFQPRLDFEKEPLLELSESIKEHGIIQPITVRKIGRNEFQIISGERRFQAAKLALIDELPCFIRIADDQHMLEMAIVENIQRKDLNAMEIALSYQRLIDECNLSQDDLGKKVSKNRSTVANYLRLLKLPLEVQKALRDDKISMGHARALLALPTEKEMINTLEEILADNLSVRAVENKRKESQQKSNSPVALTRYELRMQNNIAYQLNSKVSIKKKNSGKGQIVISFNNQDDLNRILDNFDQ
ncbi:MAG: ParB/RepB/Spo0J family partition protein [Bacteroidota bacterium]|nr:ParB/RepB/Spo0J family partition protein [Bacteroidota bacterium]|tara:strand:- start:1159 stop:2034 length:876 start_codon:yes stop_codon:yes gene_type:complete